MLDVKVKIDLTKPIGSTGFGFPLIFVVDKANTYEEFSSLEELKAKHEETTNVYKAAALMFGQNNPPQKVAVYGDATKKTPEFAVGSGDWRQIVPVAETQTSTDYAEVLSTWVETSNAMLFLTVADVDDLAAIAGKTRTVGFVHSNPLASAALAGEAAGRVAGSFTYKNLILSGIAPMSLSDTEIEAIHKANGFTFVTKAGDNVTTEGIVMSGEYIDIMDIQDYIVSNLTYKTQKLLNTSAKIPFDNNGIAMLESVAVDVMNDCYNKGMIASNQDGSPAYVVNYALRDEVSAENRAARKYVGGSFVFTASGAIHNVDITGEIII